MFVGEVRSGCARIWLVSIVCCVFGVASDSSLYSSALLFIGILLLRKTVRRKGVANSTFKNSLDFRIVYFWLFFCNMPRPLVCFFFAIILEQSTKSLNLMELRLLTSRY